MRFGLLFPIAAMILEGIVTTQSAAGEINIAPMGPRVDAEMKRFLLRPFNTSTTYRNLREHGEGVLHVTDDVLLLARAALGHLDPLPRLAPARTIRGWVLPDACRCYEFRVVSIDDSTERVSIEVEVVDSRTFRDFFGFNRAKHAVVEAAILATRTHLLPREEIAAEFARLGVIVQKTAGEQERQAFAFLQKQVGLLLSSQTNGSVGGGSPSSPAPLPEGEGRNANAAPLPEGEGRKANAAPLRADEKRDARGIRVRAASRLHFGLLNLGGCGADLPQRRMFGGVGLMVDLPGVEVSVRKANRFGAAGPLADRALQFAERYVASAGLSQPVHVDVAHAPPDHVGLGTGTQLGLAVARGIAELAGMQHDAVSLARHVERGVRSAIGVHGFDHGGFLVEAGKVSKADISPLVGRWDFPDDWRVLLVIPGHLKGTHGSHELAAFADLQRQSSASHSEDAMSRLVLLGMIPALLDRDLDQFGEALHEYNRKAGEMFFQAQNGIYADPWIAHAVDEIRKLGVRGVGQSSWGPAVFAIVHHVEADRLANELARRLNPSEVIAARGCNRGAEVSSTS